MVRDIPNISLCDVYELILPDKNLLLHDLFGEFSTFATRDVSWIGRIRREYKVVLSIIGHQVSLRINDVARSADINSWTLDNVRISNKLRRSMKFPWSFQGWFG